MLHIQVIDHIYAMLNSVRAECNNIAQYMLDTKKHEDGMFDGEIDTLIAINNHITELEHAKLDAQSAALRYVLGEHTHAVSSTHVTELLSVNTALQELAISIGKTHEPKASIKASLC